MTRFRARGALLSLLLLAATVARADGAGRPLSDVIRVKRPVGGEYFGLYLLDKKVGYMFSDLTFAPGSKDQLMATQEYVFKAGVGSKVSERYQRDVRIYEAKPGGRLLSFVVELKGDGGDQRLEATATSAGLTVVRKRPGMPTEVRNLPPSREKVEDADQARVALLRNQTVEGTITDGEDLGSYKLTTTVEKTEVRTLGGVKVKLHSVSTISEKEHIPATLYLAEGGEVVEVDFGGTMRAAAEPEAVAKRLDQVEVFGLTRVMLPKLLPASAREVPGSLTLVMTGLPERFWRANYRQSFKKLPGDKVEVTITAEPPKLAKKMVRPLWDPNGGANLKSTIVVEADDPKMVATARKIAGEEKDAYATAKKVVQWVNRNMEKDYGASADRATDVLRQMKGDCTEHSLLTVALLRSLGIPAKRIDGVVYLVNEDKVPALYWHEWVEAWVGEWTQLDPTFDQSVSDATHFAVGEEGNAEIIPLIGQMKVVEVR